MAISEALKKALARESEIDLTVKGRTSGRTITMPVWFVWEPSGDDGTLYLLPAYGTDTQWYKNVLHDPAVGIKASQAETQAKVIPITDTAKVAAVVEKFRARYGAGNVKTYYRKLDVAATVQF